AVGQLLGREPPAAAVEVLVAGPLIPRDAVVVEPVDQVDKDKLAACQGAPGDEKEAERRREGTHPNLANHRPKSLLCIVRLKSATLRVQSPTVPPGAASLPPSPRAIVSASATRLKSLTALSWVLRSTVP